MDFKLKTEEREAENQVIFTLLVLNNNLDLIQRQSIFLSTTTEGYALDSQIRNGFTSRGRA